MPDQKRPIDRLLDLTLYAPLGFVMNLEELIPQLIEKGHQQVNMARMFGQFAVKAGGDEARKRVEQVTDQVGDLMARRAAGAAGGGAGAVPASVTENGAAPSVAQDGAARPAARPAAPDAGSLGITDYDALSASQVVPRLAGLTSAELEAVRRYEVANRGRKTILAKITQLQG